MKKANLTHSQVASYILLLLAFIEAIYFRIRFIDYISQDYIYYFQKWYNHIIEAGFFRAFKYNFSNYTPAYLHLLGLATLFPIKDLYAIKIIGFSFEVLSAIAVYKILYHKFKNSIYSLWGCVTVLLCPTLILNSSWWVQCDIIFTCMLLFSFYYISTGKVMLSYIFFGAAIAFKLQAIFVLPVYILLALYNFRNIKFLFLIPFIYVISILPSWFAGRNFIELLTIYSHQAVANTQLFLGFPSVYAIIPDSQNNLDFWSKYGTIAGFGFMFFIVSSAWYKAKGKETDNDFILKTYILSAVVIPFILPHMHERYFFIADVFSIVYVFYFKRNYFIPFIIITGSLIGYLEYLVGYHYILLQSELAYAALVVALYLFYDFLFHKLPMKKEAVVIEKSLNS